MCITPDYEVSFYERHSNFYRRNTLILLERIDEQFISAIKEVNRFADENGYQGIFFTINKVHRKGGIPEGQEFRELTSYSVSIAKVPKMGFRLNPPHHSSKTLFLGTFHPCQETESELKSMAETGNISTFTDIFDRWTEKFKNDVLFFQQNRQQIQATKAKINAQFIRAIKEAKTYASENGLDIEINSQCWPFHTVLIDSPYAAIVFCLRSCNS